MRSDACGSLVPNRLRTCVKRRPEEAAHPCVGTRRLPAFDVPRAHHLSCNFDQNTHGHTQSEPSDVHCTRKNKPKNKIMSNARIKAPTATVFAAGSAKIMSGTRGRR